MADDDPRPGYADDLERARTGVYPLVEPAVRDYVERLFETYIADEALLDYEPALLHADLAPDHIRFSPEEGRITGIIDWVTLRSETPTTSFRTCTSGKEPASSRRWSVTAPNGTG